MEHELSMCDTDPQDGLAVLNAALTLNSLLAKAKAQEAASQAANRVSLQAAQDPSPENSNESTDAGMNDVS